MMQWYRAWQERRRQARRERDALVQIVALLRENDAMIRRVTSKLQALYDETTEGGA